MRGLIVTLETGTAERSHDAERVLSLLADWRAKFAPESIRNRCIDRFTCSLFSECATAPEYNQVLHDAADAVALHVGPRLTWRGVDPLPHVDTDNLDRLASRRDLFTQGMETDVIVVYRREAKTLLIKTDLLNSTFVYMARVDGLLMWSTSSLLLARLTRCALHPVSMMEFVIEGNVYGQRSLYDGIRLLEPSRWYRFDSDAREESIQYWRIDRLALESIGMREACDVLIAELDRDFQAMRRSGRMMVLDLTGGYDSRTNVGFALRNGLRFRTIVSGETSSDDVRVAARLAERFGIDHRCVAPPSGDLDDWLGAIDAAHACTDGEYDLIEYAHIFNVHRNHYAADEISVHGSTADLTRHYYFYPLSPHGHFPLDKLIAKKFTPLVDSRQFFRADLAIDWVPHMMERIGEIDHPSLPAFARLNNIYLRLRMQPWQGRIATSTNRLHSSFTPWTSVPALEAILTARWGELENRRLTRQLIHDVHPGLDRIEMAGGSIAGVGLSAALRALPSASRFYTGKVIERLGRYRRQPPRAPRIRGLREYVAREVGELDDLLQPQMVDAISCEHLLPTLSEAVLGKLYTLIRARKLSRRWASD